jgi:transcriptional regulator with XRE-family HTH domain
LAALAGSSNKTIVQLENGRQTASLVTIEKISRALKVEPREVTEFARAIDVRSGVLPAEELLDAANRLQAKHVLCVSGATLFHALTRRLLDIGHVGVTTTVGVPVTARQITCMRPDVLILDLDAGPAHALGLLKHLQDDAAADLIPIVVTGRDQGRLDDVVAEHGQAEVTVAPWDRDLHGLVAAVEAFLSRADPARNDGRTDDAALRSEKRESYA